MGARALLGNVECPKLTHDFGVRCRGLDVENFLVVGLIADVRVKHCAFNEARIQTVENAVGLVAVGVQTHVELAAKNVGQVVVGHFKCLAHKGSERVDVVSLDCTICYPVAHVPEPLGRFHSEPVLKTLTSFPWLATMIAVKKQTCLLNNVAKIESI